MATTQIDAAANFPDSQVDPEKGAQWRVLNGRGVTEEVRGWFLEIVDGALVLRGGQRQFLRAWGPTGWTRIERVWA